MVLKKSNSGLNSGATQRVTKGGTLKAFKLDNYTEKTIGFTLNVRDSGEKQKHSITECIQKIWDRLEWNGPDLFHLFQDQFKSLGSWMTIELGSFSMNKRNTWILAERMQSMMKDHEFLREIVQNLEVTMTEFREIPNLRYSKRKLKVSQASKVGLTTETKPREQCKKSRRRQTVHNRGIQRTHIFQRPIEPQENEHNFININKQPPNLDVTIYHPYHIDARCANKNDINRFKTKYCYKMKKASTKSKGAVNGRYEELKGYTRHDILEDTYLALSDPTSQYAGTYSTSNTCFVNTTETKTASNYTLCDFIVLNKTKIKRQKNRKDRQVKKEDVNCTTDLNDQLKYPKGSFIVIPNEASEHLTQASTWEILSGESINTNKPDTRQRKESGYVSHSEDIGHNTIISNSNIGYVNLVEQELSEYEQLFVDVTLVMTGEIEHLFESDNQTTYILGRKVQIGRCHPHCFVVTLNESVRNECYLVGKKIDPNSSSWHVSFQCENYCDANMKLQNVLFEEWTCCMKLSHLIELALDVSNQETVCPEPEVCVEKIPLPSTGPTHISETVIFCTTEKAITYLTKPNEHFPVDSSDMNHMIKTEDSPYNHECPVCLLPYNVQTCLAKKLLPCGHTFCVKCWQTHIMCGIQQGVKQFYCLALNCKNIVDTVTLLTLLPHNIINKWQKQIWGKAIEASPYCNWCPNDTCENVALSLSAPLKTKFGQQVTCTCGHSWCGACKDTPHWPASCDQMAAYKKLLTKAGVNKDFTYGTVDFFIRLKPCPQCEYPIEKNEGCPAMVCRICGFYFCWNCLGSVSSHVVYECRHRDETFVLFNLQNKLVHDLPLKYFTECIETNHKHKTHAIAMKKWLNYYRKPLPSDYVVKVKSFTDCIEVDVTCIVHEAERCLTFTENCHKFEEKLYLLLGFAHMNKALKPKQLIDKVLFKCSQLQFVTQRLTEHILGKPSHEIYKRLILSKRLLSIGEKIISDLRQIVPSLQDISKDVDTKSVGEMDPLKHLRYK